MWSFATRPFVRCTGTTTAFGKTVVGTYMVAARKVNTLILVHNTESLKNRVEDLEKFIVIDEELPEYQTKTGVG